MKSLLTKLTIFNTTIEGRDIFGKASRPSSSSLSLPRKGTCSFLWIFQSQNEVLMGEQVDDVSGSMWKVY